MTFDDYCTATGHYAENGDRALWEAATKAEREACAKVCDEQAKEPECPERAMYCADAIRARSND